MKLSFALLPMAMAGTLTFGRHANLQAKIQTTAANQLSMTTTGCVDVSISIYNKQTWPMLSLGNIYIPLLRVLVAGGIFIRVNIIMTGMQNACLILNRITP